MLAAKRFAWQASGGRRNKQMQDEGTAPIGKRVQIRWGDALKLLTDEGVAGTDESGQRCKIDLLFLDGTPKESLQYLQAAEPQLASGAVVIADNAGVHHKLYHLQAHTAHLLLLALRATWPR